MLSKEQRSKRKMPLSHIIKWKEKTNIILFNEFLNLFLKSEIYFGLLHCKVIAVIFSILFYSNTTYGFSAVMKRKKIVLFSLDFN